MHMNPLHSGQKLNFLMSIVSRQLKHVSVSTVWAGDSIVVSILVSPFRLGCLPCCDELAVTVLGRFANGVYRLVVFAKPEVNSGEGLALA